jgi:hypothetical protein
MKIAIVAIAIFLLNIPFGYWRVNVARLSNQWFLAIHLPIPIVIALRVLSGLGWELITSPVFVGAFLCGQICGGFIHNVLRRLSSVNISSCIFCDLWKILWRQLSPN